MCIITLHRKLWETHLRAIANTRSHMVYLPPEWPNTSKYACLTPGRQAGRPVLDLTTSPTKILHGKKPFTFFSASPFYSIIVPFLLYIYLFSRCPCLLAPTPSWFWQQLAFGCTIIVTVILYLLTYLLGPVLSMHRIQRPRRRGKGA